MGRGFGHEWCLILEGTSEHRTPVAADSCCEADLFSGSVDNNDNNHHNHGNYDRRGDTNFIDS